MTIKLFIFSGQAGVGKNTIIKKLLEKHPDFYKVVTCTTRPPRAFEINGKDKFFLSDEDFKKKIDEGGFLEYMPVHSWMYGTPKEQVEFGLGQGKNTVMEIDVKGALHVKKQIPEAVLIFIEYPEGDLDTLIHERIKNDPARPNITEKEIQTRIETAKKEKEYKKNYDYAVTNLEGELEKTVLEVEEIIKKETQDDR